ncbi:MAG: DUF177 domain-containing protein [Deltaproteobacteria bacterium]|jgi:uncharacterized protein|nr:DUF177 domain-containing protein [Deltaproteobacteria bacterium]
MRYKTRDIGEGGIDLRVAVSEAWLAAECPDASFGLSKTGICLEGRLEPAGQGYLLRGMLRGELLVPCARCLEPAPVKVEAPLAVSFVESKQGDDPEALEPQDDVLLIEHGTIDLSRPIRDEILLAIPMSPVCRPDCAGICPTCGRNRNVTPCGCDRQAPEISKFGALAKMKLQ